MGGSCEHHMTLPGAVTNPASLASWWLQQPGLELLHLKLLLSQALQERHGQLLYGEIKKNKNKNKNPARFWEGVS